MKLTEDEIKELEEPYDDPSTKDGRWNDSDGAGIGCGWVAVGETISTSSSS